jgi:signal transduction histidine kinase
MAQRGGRNESDFIASLFEVPCESNSGSLDAYLEDIVSRCGDWFGATSISLFLTDQDPQKMQLAASAGLAQGIPKDACIEVGKGIAGTAAADGKPRLIDDRNQASEFRHLVGRARNPVESSMVVPLMARVGCIGVLNLARQKGLDGFVQADLRLAKGVAGHLALAIENARLVANLQTERAKFESIFEGLGSAAFLLDEHGRILESNLAARDPQIRQLGLLKEISGPYSPRALEVADANSGRSWIATINPIYQGATLILQETTEYEKQRHEVSRLSRLAEIGQMTAAVAHEIRNPLTGIRSAAQMIKQAPETAKEFAEIIVHEAIKLNDLCDEFLNFARPVQLRRARLDFAGVVQRACNLLRPEFDAKGVSLDIQIAEEMPKIVGDPSGWEQALTNLLINALQATPAGGHVQVGANPSRFWVEDDGQGMSEIEAERAFSPFFTTKPQGTGLGLSVVKKIVDAHEGSISVSSEPGTGTRFEDEFAKRRAA